MALNYYCHAGILTTRPGRCEITGQWCCKRILQPKQLIMDVNDAEFLVYVAHRIEEACIIQSRNQWGLQFSLRENCLHNPSNFRKLFSIFSSSIEPSLSAVCATFSFLRAKIAAACNYEAIYQTGRKYLGLYFSTVSNVLHTIVFHTKYECSRSGWYPVNFLNSYPPFEVKFNKGDIHWLNSPGFSCSVMWNVEVYF